MHECAYKKKKTTITLTITLSLTEVPQPYVTDKKEAISCVITEKRLSLQYEIL